MNEAHVISSDPPPPPQVAQINIWLPFLYSQKQTHYHYSVFCNHMTTTVQVCVASYSWHLNFICFTLSDCHMTIGHQNCDMTWLDIQRIYTGHNGCTKLILSPACFNGQWIWSHRIVNLLRMFIANSSELGYVAVAKVLVFTTPGIQNTGSGRSWPASGSDWIL